MEYCSSASKELIKYFRRNSLFILNWNAMICTANWYDIQGDHNRSKTTQYVSTLKSIKKPLNIPEMRGRVPTMVSKYTQIILRLLIPVRTLYRSALVWNTRHITAELDIKTLWSRLYWHILMVILYNLN